MKNRIIAISIVATEKHCDNDCEFMSTDAKQCDLFKMPLKWDRRKKFNGNLRLDECKLAEIYSSGE